jgi:6,7-dimethyl-8-ribityllumazine synthase
VQNGSGSLNAIFSFIIMTKYIAIVAADFDIEISSAMVDAAVAQAQRLGCEVRVIRVPGCLEVPLAVARQLRDPITDAAVVLGYIEKGETLHGEVMGHAVQRALIDLSIHHDKPIGTGIIGPGATLSQAQQRKDSYAVAAVRAVAKVLKLPVD